MTDAEAEAQKARVQALIDKWLVPLGLRWWRLHFQYDRAPKATDGEISRCVAECWPDWRYGEATIRFYLPCVADQDDDELEYAFVHECQHCFLHETREGAHEDGWPHEEHAATRLALAFQSVWRCAFEAGREAALAEAPQRASMGERDE